MILYLSLMILVAAFIIGVISIVPIIYLKKTSTRPRKIFLFNETLFNRDMDDLKFERGSSDVSKLDAADRGWVRKPKGEVLSIKDFEEKKQREYLLKLP